MKLIICRNQADKTGLFGGHKGVNFQLSAKVELTENERSLVQKYKAEDTVLNTIGPDLEKLKLKSPFITMANLMGGWDTANVTDVGLLLDLEELIKDACQTFKNYLEVMASFGGEEIVDY